MLDEWVEAVKNVSVLEVVKEEMNVHRSDIIRLNQEQLKQGIKSTGERLSPYHPDYARRKKKPITPKTLYDKGSFHGAIYAIPTLSHTLVGSRDSKADVVENQESYKSHDDPDDIYGLTDESLERLLDEFGMREGIINGLVSRILT